MKLLDLIELCRPWQWYKNFLIYLAIIFTSQLLNINKFILVTWGFLSLCLTSSSYYIINDIIDRKYDRFHPEKRKRPIASGKIKAWEGMVLFTFLLTSAIILAWSLGIQFTAIVIFMFLFTQLYNFVLKKEAYIDIISIAILFVVRAISGTYILKIDVSPWLILCTFFLALVLGSAKRFNEIQTLGKKASKHRRALKGYTIEMARTLMIITTTLLLLSYALYSFLSKNNLLLFSIPIAFYATLRYMALVQEGSEIARHPHLGYKDIRLLISMGVWTAFVLIVMTV